MTKREGYELMMTIKECPYIVDFARHEIELMDNYESTIKNQTANNDIIKRKGE